MAVDHSLDRLQPHTGVVVGPPGVEEFPGITPGFADIVDDQTDAAELALEAEEGLAVMGVPGVELAVQEALDLGL